MEYIQLSLFGKTCPEHSLPIKAKTSDAPLKSSSESARKYLFLDLRADAGHSQERSWVPATVSRGGSSTRNTGEYPRDAEESTLWQILQEDAPERYCLSAKACEGILRRAERRGKALPQILRDALEEAVRLG